MNPDPIIPSSASQMVEPGPVTRFGPVRRIVEEMHDLAGLRFVLLLWNCQGESEVHGLSGDEGARLVAGCLHGALAWECDSGLGQDPAEDAVQAKIEKLVTRLTALSGIGFVACFQVEGDPAWQTAWSRDLKTGDACAAMVELLRDDLGTG